MLFGGAYNLTVTQLILGHGEAERGFGEIFPIEKSFSFIFFGRFSEIYLPYISANPYFPIWKTQSPNQTKPWSGQKY